MITRNIIQNNTSGIMMTDASPSIMHNSINSQPGDDISIIGSSSITNISFNIYDSLWGSDTGVGQYNVKSDGSSAPTP